jgi:hypothetical protein
MATQPTPLSDRKAARRAFPASDTTPVTADNFVRAETNMHLGIGGPDRMEFANSDRSSPKKLRDTRLALNSTLPDLRRACGGMDQLAPVRHGIGTASVWDLNRDVNATYRNVMPAMNAIPWPISAQRIWSSVTGGPAEC